jgi:hypothetical protein
MLATECGARCAQLACLLLHGGAELLLNVDLNPPDIWETSTCHSQRIVEWIVSSWHVSYCMAALSCR